MTCGSKTVNVGGIVGISQCSVKGCTNDGKIVCRHEANHISAPAEAVLNVAGIIGYNYVAVEDCTNNGSLEAYGTGSGRVGGVVGMYGKGTSNCLSCTNTGDITYTHKYDNAHNTYFGGVIGCMNVNANIEDAKNSGNLVCNQSSKNTTSYMGGISGYNNVTTSAYDKNCENTGNLTIDAGGMNTDKVQLYVGGCFGCCKGASSSKCYYQNCSNSGDVNLSNMDVSKVATINYTYVGGVHGGYSTTAPYIENCRNTGNVVSTVISKVRIGGITGGANATLTDCIHEGDVTVSNSLASSQVGLLAGYFSGTKIEGSSAKGAVTVSNSKSTSVGGVIGENGTTATRVWHTFNAEVTITSDSQDSGIFIGKLNDNSTAGKGGVTLGKEDGPVTFKSTCSLNGTAISATPTVGELVGTKKTDATPFNLANVVVE